MSDYISKKKLISHIEAEYKSFGEDYDALQILGDIEDFKTEERPHGEWIEQSDNYGDPYYECSVCEDAFITLEGTPKENHYNFCPNCGADMRRSEAE